MPTRLRRGEGARVRCRGIGLCRTEHMFFGAERNEAIVAVILAETDEEREAGLRKLLPLQQGDFEEIFAAMAGLPVTVRLLDPPLPKFLPSLPDVEERLREAEEAGSAMSRRSNMTSPGSACCRRSIRCWGPAACGWDPLPAIYDAGRGDLRRPQSDPRHGLEVSAEIMVPLVDYRRS